MDRHRLLTGLFQVRFVGDLLDLVKSVVGDPAGDLQLLVPGVVAHDHFHHKTVELSFGEFVGSLLLHRVLGRHNEKGQPDFEGFVPDGHLPLLHHLQQGRLDFRRSPVDLIGQQEVGEDGAFFDLESVVGGIVDLGPDDVAGKKVRGELDPFEVQSETLGQGVDRRGLGQAGHPFEEDMPPGQESGQQRFDHLLLPDDDFAYFVLDPCDRLHDVAPCNVLERVYLSEFN